MVEQQTAKNKTEQNILSALQWHMLCDADNLISNQPHDWYQKPLPTKIIISQANSSTPHNISGTNVTNTQNLQSTLPSHQPPPAIAGSLALIEKATNIAEKCNDWQDLITAINAFTDHPLAQTASHCLTHQSNHQGNPDNFKLMIIGNVPSKNDEINGDLFSGEAGALLDKMLKAIQLSRSDCLLSNIIYWRPPGDRNLTDNEIEICRPFFEKMLSFIQPKIIMAIGNVTANALHAGNHIADDKKPKIHKIINYQNRFMSKSVPLINSLHPSFLLRVPDKKRSAWQDLLAIQEIITHNTNN
ncbi:MAG: uracil-DNA glycosylase [Alphaproteobacteria bacterium]|nr:uracil-DNA glycosylase [Alphaproteobacteria bacterium]